MPLSSDIMGVCSEDMLEVGFQNNICDLLGGVLEYMTRPIISEACVRTITGLGYNTTRGLDRSYMEMYDGGHLWPLYGRY